MAHFWAEKEQSQEMARLLGLLNYVKNSLAKISENNFIRKILFSSLETAIDFTWRKVGGSQRKLDEKSNQQYVNQNQPNCNFEMCYYTDGKNRSDPSFIL
jgi:hypothetical protein